MLRKQIKQHIKNIMHHMQITIFEEMKCCSTILKSNIAIDIHRIKAKSNIIPVSSEKAFEKIQHLFMTQALNKLRMKNP